MVALEGVTEDMVVVQVVMAVAAMIPASVVAMEAMVVVVLAVAVAVVDSMEAEEHMVAQEATVTTLTGGKSMIT